MIVISGKNDGFAGNLSGFLPDSVIHQIPDDGAVGIAVENLFVDLMIFKIEIFRLFAVLFELTFLFVVKVLIFYAFSEKLGGVGIDFIWYQVAFFNGLIQCVINCRRFVVAVEHAECVPGDKAHRRGGKADLETIEIAKHITITVVNAAVGLIGNDQVEKAHVKGLKDLVHRRIGGQVDAFVAILGRTGIYNGHRFAEKIVVRILGLFTKLFSIA